MILVTRVVVLRNLRFDCTTIVRWKCRWIVKALHLDGSSPQFSQNLSAKPILTKKKSAHLLVAGNVADFATKRTPREFRRS